MIINADIAMGAMASTGKAIVVSIKERFRTRVIYSNIIITFIFSILPYDGFNENFVECGLDHLEAIDDRPGRERLPENFLRVDRVVQGDLDVALAFYGLAEQFIAEE
jgi:hypothetical protein